ncbi:MAG: putative nicotinate-nucleotide adenylyltransferase [Candidatus Accumulibacter appositus]|uniref:Probable nicotinate-nucleotide adenylyltransferase n=1 Tax=Candidatus Accumulibacter appositus TaxID=1454003 RepID=A0A011QQR0_9PROT|nr:nicotinate-nucleotide adenylyltransferase [Accumulibacter sp.]EXI81239.1 MAG: putative nicotinate-nucleotide adenylyltransferase [Candidatus Accumulibacter appositus]HRF06387.1 nicotinate-nucleotide adenylyltransferase [Accumulibacter sp.]
MPEDWRERPLGIFGGTFDPVHFGHLRLAEEAADHLQLGEVCWIPAGQPPLRAAPQVSARHRLAMVRLATARNPSFEVDAAEVDTAQASYTVLTLERLRQANQLGQRRPLVLLLGADAFAALPGWHRWQSLLELAHIGVAHRPGFPIDVARLPEALLACYRERFCAQPAALRESAAGRIATFAMTPLGISATQIRTLLANGSSPRYLLPDEVIAYIRNHRLYPEK